MQNIFSSIKCSYSNGSIPAETCENRQVSTREGCLSRRLPKKNHSQPWSVVRTGGRRGAHIALYTIHKSFAQQGVKAFSLKTRIQQGSYWTIQYWVVKWGGGVRNQVAPDFQRADDTLPGPGLMLPLLALQACSGFVQTTFQTSSALVPCRQRPNQRLACLTPKMLLVLA